MEFGKNYFSLFWLPSRYDHHNWRLTLVFRTSFQIMRPFLYFILALAVGILLCGKGSSEQNRDFQTVPKPEASKLANPMTNFERFVSGEWRQMASSGQSMYHTWHWGPGKHSIRRMTEGLGAGGQPWSEIQVFYWHPGRNKVCVLGLSPFDRGVNEGTFTWLGDKAEGDFDLFQTNGRRKMKSRWVILGRDHYKESLLEATGLNRFQTLVEFDLKRTKPEEVREPRITIPWKLSEDLKAFEAILGAAWESQGKLFERGIVHSRTTFELIPLVDGIYGRMVLLENNGQPANLLDVFIYYHTGARVLRCLVLTSQGTVFEGDLKVESGGVLQGKLKGFDGGQTSEVMARTELEIKGNFRIRIWRIKGEDQNLILDILQKKVLDR